MLPHTSLTRPTVITSWRIGSLGGNHGNRGVNIIRALVFRTTHPLTCRSPRIEIGEKQLAEVVKDQGRSPLFGSSGLEG